jgi:two-component system, sensor histidine kinase and response regulator
MGTDVPEYQEACEAECMSQRQYVHALLEALPIGVCTLDAQGHIVSLNPAGERLLGWSETACIGALLHDLIDCWLQLEDEEQSLCPITQVLQTGKPAWTAKTTIRCRDGSRRPVEVKCVPLDAPGQAGAIFTFRDLSRQLQLEQQLLRLASMPEESPNPIVELDAQAHLLYANTAMMALMEQYGFGAQGYPAILPAGIDQIVSACLGSGETRAGVNVIVAAKHYMWTFFPMPQLGLLRGYGVDLTEQKRVEQELQRARDAALEASRVKSEFLANVSHELRTPLNGIIGMTELTLSTPLTAEQQEWLDTVKESAHSLHLLINDILDFSKVEAGKLELRPRPIRLRRSLDSTLKLFTLRARENGLALGCEIDPEIPDEVVADADRVRQILSNLIDNAIKFTEQGEVRIRVALAEHTTDALVVHVTVTDTGIGIPKDKQRCIFEPFTQADGSATRSHGGTGLGLTIAMQLVHMMQGEIWVESDGPATGSTFHFTMCVGVPQEPEARSATATASAHAQAVAADGGLRPLLVLLAEDNVVNQRLARSLLERRSHRVVVANNGKEALAALAEQAFDLVLMDIQMPEQDGLETTAMIRASEQASGTHLPIIALTAHTMPGDRERCLAAGMDGYVSKPIQPQDLFETIASVLALAEPQESADVATSQPDPPFDEAAFLARVDGDHTLLRELVELFLMDCPQRLTSLRQAIQDADWQAVERAAHSLKGAVSNFCARTALDATLHLESLARTGDASRIAAAYSELEHELTRLQEALVHVAAGDPSLIG